MITKYKLYENKETTVSFIPNDLIPYFEDKVDLIMLPWIGDDIKNLFNKILMDSYVEFSCERCREKGTYNTKHTNKTHKGFIRGWGFGYNYDNKVNLTLMLNRIRHDHLVDCNKSLTLKGNFSDVELKIINNVNMLSDMKKYNL